MTSNIEEHNKEVADYIQAATHYLLNHFHRSCTSYNLFFYQLDDGRSACKVIPRFATSPLFVGYGIPQVSNKIEEIAKQVHSLYFSK